MKRQQLLLVPALLFAGTQAYAGASYTLDSLLGGGSFQSDNGKLIFSDFGYQSYLNAPDPGNIAVVSLDDGVSFGTPLFTSSSSVDFNLSYKVSAVPNYLIDGVFMQSTGSGTGTGTAGVFKVVEDGSNAGLANLTNVFQEDLTMGTTSASFDPDSDIYVRDDVFLNPGLDGTAGISDFTQRFSTTSGTTGPIPTPVPSPTAAMTGAILFGVFGLRRRRRHEVVTNN